MTHNINVSVLSLVISRFKLYNIAWFLAFRFPLKKGKQIQNKRCNEMEFQNISLFHSIEQFISSNCFFVTLNELPSQRSIVVP